MLKNDVWRLVWPFSTFCHAMILRSKSENLLTKFTPLTSRQRVWRAFSEELTANKLRTFGLRVHCYVSCWNDRPFMDQSSIKQFAIQFAYVNIHTVHFIQSIDWFIMSETGLDHDNRFISGPIRLGRRIWINLN